MLTLCPTPIGNLGDVSERTLEALRNADLVACEDTRNTGKLLALYDIKKPLISYHKYNESERSDELIEKLKAGAEIALVSDAGMPGISDPGAVLVRRCHEAGVKVTVLPGPSAFVTAVALSGFDSRRFLFEGFLPTDKEEERQVLERLEKSTVTTVFYEAPHRLIKTLTKLGEHTCVSTSASTSASTGARKIALVRELTKVHEEIVFGTAEELLQKYGSDGEEPRGEMVLVIEGRSAAEVKEERQKSFEDLSLEEHMALYSDLDEKEAMKKVAKDRGVSKRDIYNALKKHKEEEDDG